MHALILHNERFINCYFIIPVVEADLSEDDVVPSSTSSPSSSSSNSRVSGESTSSNVNVSVSVEESSSGTVPNVIVNPLSLNDEEESEEERTMEISSQGMNLIHRQMYTSLTLEGTSI